MKAKRKLIKIIRKLVARHRKTRFAASSEAKPAREGITTAGFGPWPWIATFAMVFINFGKLFEFDGSTVLVIVGMVALWAPEWIWRAFHEESR
ncbi:hypothetical protein VSR69_10315 [Paraburkholderia phytofirmans]|jgi:hypothetical protein|uniref:hypothetical protein n=1 Tax=Paraburkholderia sp. BL9I2N2 TaxID=1938809 RepID=UPI001050E728|nr:hypothetical protein [Paraburkholderia sp. BL9I2N2]TCK86216.1 hypothetical protein B0G74_8762 [Paraburkholderia sp. BL9I2N2]